jgi:two-component system response regulator FixJ
MLRNIYLVDPDDNARASMHRVLAGESRLLVGAFQTVEDFFEHLDELRPGLVLLDSGTAFASDAEVIGALHDQGVGRFESIMLSDNGGIPRAVAAMKAGALDFVEKPIEAAELLKAVELAFERIGAAANERQHVELAREKLALLSKRERNVLDCLVRGLSNKVTAHELGISPRTVEFYRASMMAKMAAKALPDAIKTVFQADLARNM